MAHCYILRFIYDGDASYFKNVIGYTSFFTFALSIANIGNKGTRPLVFHLYITFIVDDVEKLFVAAFHVNLARKAS